MCASSEHTGCCTRLYDLISYQKFPLPRHAPDNINVYEGETGTSRNENFNNLRSVETRSFGSRRRHAQNINNALISESLGSFTPSKIIPVTTTTLHIRFVVSSDITSSPRRCTGAPPRSGALRDLLLVEPLARFYCTGPGRDSAGNRKRKRKMTTGKEWV